MFHSTLNFDFLDTSTDYNLELHHAYSKHCGQKIGLFLLGVVLRTGIVAGKANCA